ncbi:ankyrin repeat, SAM and basic leucine zipper domain-containing protein 1-like isoform X2 [Corticium candelabrum]|uniref:ankyrin repeat, SAM and basic leucine zipper domain-containing protein 1-like isoform X2 n=1 Tax=Corticium candelabrum TaxID=121492 RepID=UPI002E2657C2|nr:ankyrin repeat, SAM and basic leucine zipper domain-containing protein 1-like isoform X2 [Corticium candelabrum]
MEKELCEAVRRGDIHSVTGFLDMGVDINQRDEDGNTLLIQACWKNKKEMVKLLLTNKLTDANGTGIFGWTPLITAASNGLYNIFDMLLKTKDINVMKGDDAGMTAIHHAAMNNHVTIVDSLVSCSVPVDINDNGGCTPLWWAACNGDVCCVDVLLKLGASPLHESKLEGSPLEIAKEKGHSDVVEMMEEAIRLKTPKREEHVATVTLLKRQLAEKDVQLQSKSKEVAEKDMQLQSQNRKVASLETRLARIGDIANVESDEVVEDDVTAARVESTASSFAQSTEDDHRQDSYSRRVLRAIQRVGSTRWYALGRDCGQTNDQLREFTFLVNDCDKVQALFDVMAQKVGGKRAADKLLDACQTMQNPIFAEVEEVMDKM